MNLKYRKNLCTILAISLLAGNMLPQAVLANIKMEPQPVQNMTAGENSQGVGDTAFEAISTLGWKKADKNIYYTDSKRIQFENLSGVNGQDAKITFRCAADEDILSYLLSLMIGEESEFSYLELERKIGNGSNPVLQDGTRTICVRYDGKLDFTATVLFFNYGYVASEAEKTQYIEPVMKPVVVPAPIPTPVPSVRPTITPSAEPSKEVTVTPDVEPSQEVTVTPSVEPSTKPSEDVEVTPSVEPATEPSEDIEVTPSLEPSTEPSTEASDDVIVTPSMKPSVTPSKEPGTEPGTEPSTIPSAKPSVVPSTQPSQKPIVTPTVKPVTVAAVKNVSVSRQKQDSLTVHWSSVKNITGYQVYVRETGTKQYYKAAEVVAKNQKVSINKLRSRKLSSGVTYEVKVRAYKKTGTGVSYGSYSKVLVTSTKLTAPSTTVKSSKNRLVINWKRDKKAEG